MVTFCPFGENPSILSPSNSFWIAVSPHFVI
jgi:hypothetical protein